MTAALVVGAPIAWVALVLARRRRPWSRRAGLVATMVAATASRFATGLFSDPTAVAAAAPVLAAIVVTRVPGPARGGAVVIPLLALGWLGGVLGSGWSIPARSCICARRSMGKVGSTSDSTRSAPAARGWAHGRAGRYRQRAGRAGPRRRRRILGLVERGRSRSALLFQRIETAFVARPGSASGSGANDQLEQGLSDIFRDGAPGYDVIYQNNTWRVFGHVNIQDSSKP